MPPSRSRPLRHRRTGSALKRRRQMRRNLESQAGRRALAAGRMGAVGLLVLISLPGPGRADVVTDWNPTTLRAAAAAGLNPQRQHRGGAMGHAAMHDAGNSAAPRYEAYAGRGSPSRGGPAE